MAKWKEVSDEEFYGFRDRSRRYVGAGIIENVILSTLTTEALSEAAYSTIFSDKERLVEPTRDDVKKYFKDLRRKGNFPMSSNIETDGVVIDFYIQNIRSQITDFNEKLYRLAEFLMRQYDKESPFCQQGNKATPEKVFDDFEISNYGKSQIPRFNKIVVGEVNEKLKEKIESAGKLSFGDIFYDVVPALGENIRELYRWTWALLARPEPERGLAASALYLYNLDMGRTAARGEKIIITLPDRTVELPPLKRPIEPEEVALRTLEMLDVFEAGNPVFTPEELSQRRVERQSMLLKYSFAEYRLRKQKKADSDKTISEVRKKADERVSKIVEEERKKLEGELSDLRQKAGEAVGLKQEADKKDREIKAKDSQLAERDKEIERVTGLLDASSIKSLKKLRDENKVLVDRVSGLKEEAETIGEENETAWKAVDELEEKLKRHESAARGRKDPYFVLVDELDGTPYAGKAHIYATAIYHASKKGRVGNVSMESLVKNTTGKLPDEKVEDVKQVLQELVDAGVYKPRTQTDGPFRLNTKLEEITDSHLRRVVKKMAEMKAKGEL